MYFVNHLVSIGFPIRNCSVSSKYHVCIGAVIKINMTHMVQNQC